MTNIWDLVVSGSLGFAGGLIGGTFKWFFPSRKDWVEARKVKREAKIDAKVLVAISNFSLWRGARPLTGAGVPAVRAAEIANHLGLDLNTVADGLERLGIAGKVRKGEGTLDNPSPYWNFVPR